MGTMNVMNPVRVMFGTALLVSMSMSALGAPQYIAKDDTPAFNAKPPLPSAKLPPILKPSDLSADAKKYPFQVKAYMVAARIHRVLHQLPCYCHCDRGYGHNSLRSCFADEHGAHCGTCMQELFYADQMLKQGKTAKQIREGIMRGEAGNIDLNRA
ncbi:MAG: hypothetical protein NVS9B15_19910 [Acidobacteriaceae bacterium]